MFCSACVVMVITSKRGGQRIEACWKTKKPGAVECLRRQPFPARPSDPKRDEMDRSGLGKPRAARDSRVYMSPIMDLIH